MTQRPIASSATFLVGDDGVLVVQEHDDLGNHRICVGESKSDWTAYGAIARLEIGARLFIGTSEYFDGEMPRVGLVSAGVMS
jgi:hypothetical protein